MLDGRRLRRFVRGRAGAVKRALFGTPARYELDLYWRDATGVFVAGRVFPANMPGPAEFECYLPGQTGPVVTVDAPGERGPTRCHIVLPTHPLPPWPAENPVDHEACFARLNAEAPPGSVVSLGARSADGSEAERLRGLLPGRHVIVVDVHYAADVDLVGDAHALSRFLRPGSVAAVVSGAFLEHVAAPWVVAAEVQRVLAPGGLTLHNAPTVWPEHSAPNDFWRFSKMGLASLFGPALGFDVLDTWAWMPVSIVPSPDERGEQLRMPVLTTPAFAGVLARKVRELPDDAVWPWDTDRTEQRARRYPVDGLAPVQSGRHPAS